MIITKQTVADQIAAYLHHDLMLAQLVDWSETAMMDGEFEDEDIGLLADIVGRLGLADVGEFGLRWEDCEGFLRKLGYAARVEVVAA